MISSAPSLQKLELENVWMDCDDFDEWVIHQAPNLQTLTIGSDSDYGWQIEEFSTLQRVTINVDEYSVGRDFVKLLTCFKSRFLSSTMRIMSYRSGIFHLWKKQILVLKPTTMWIGISQSSHVFCASQGARIPYTGSRG
nr:uncharacterized protein LOC117859853 [Setaria viridis]